MNKTRPREWYHDFFGGLYGRVLGGRTHEKRAPREAASIKKVLHLRKGQRVLDCPCGLGRIARELARLGLEVTGVDLMASYVRRARRRAARRGLAVRFVQGDMRELPFEKEFHAVVNWFTSFGYFDAAGDLACAQAAFRALRPGGKFLIEMTNKSWVQTHWHPTGDETVSGVRIVRRSRRGRQGRVFNTWTFSKGRRRETHRFSHSLYTACQMRGVLAAAGFRDIRLLGYPPLSRLTRHSRRMIAIARRPE
ncbi:MAG: methyltransferase domain-containing protein [Phycisphaerae bacterium]|nr:methyltransferase domain-containing protein [Phycisphaerae bacterium]